MLRSALSTLLGLAVLAASSAWISSVTLAAEPNAEVKTTTTPAAARPAFTPEQEQFFEREVQPILAGKCLKCHGGEEKVASGFFITSRAAIWAFAFAIPVISAGAAMAKTPSPNPGPPAGRRSR